ncbi:MAG: hypothetical protein II304_06170 [Bacteroidales bacterium]|nr:hypothetical protein [Bacteroidales bacterium]
MNPDFYEERYDLYKRRYEIINSYYENDDNFTERDNEPRYSRRDFDYECELMREQAMSQADLKSRELIKRYEEEIERLELENIQLEKDISSMKDTIKKVKMMEELLNQYALYSEIDFDRSTFSLIL